MGRGHTEAAVDEYGFKRNYVDIWGNGSRDRRDERTLIEAGNWVMIIKSLPVSDAVAPQIYGIYWAVPFVREGKAGVKDKLGFWAGTEIKTLIGVDEYGRQCAKIYTPHEVKIFPDEYSILTPERLEEYKQAGWYMQEINAKAQQPLNMDIINDGRALCGRGKRNNLGADVRGADGAAGVRRVFFNTSYRLPKYKYLLYAYKRDFSRGYGGIWREIESEARQ